MKQRFSSLDVKVIAHELSATLTTLRVANIYDLSSRIFLIKFQKPSQREQLIVDSGFRAHLTSFSRTAFSTPSPFVVRLRKYLKTRRVTSVAQVGTDRIIEFQFSDGQYRLFLEFYAGGNIILTDGDCNILALLRNVSEGAEHEKLSVGVKYDLEHRQNYGGVPELTQERVTTGLKNALAKQQQQKDKAKKGKSKPGDSLRKALAVSITEYPPMLIDHALKKVGFEAPTNPEDILEDDELLRQLMSVLKQAEETVKEITSADVAKGYILAKEAKKSKATSADDDEESSLLYDDFHPFRPKQFEDDQAITFLEFEGFNKTVDKFYSSIEGQKLESRLVEREETAKRKLEQARQEHAKRIGGLQQVQELNVRRAAAIEANVERVGEATAAVNGLIAQGMDWVDIGRLIENEQKRGNVVAQMIRLPLKLHENTATLLLDEAENEEENEDFEGSETDSEPSDSDDSEAQPRKPSPKAAEATNRRLTIDIDLSLSPWANAKQYYEQKKIAVVKEEKTLQASDKALKSAEQKIAADLKKGLKQEKEVLRPVRKQHWFEKFLYFISSDGYLVLGGKDTQQNEVLYRKHLRKGDIYVHADLPNAASVIIKNNPATPNAPIPPSTLSQAGNYSVATSTAWDSKAVMSAWWVNSDQVSKTASTGDFLDVGKFEVKGKKNFLPPSQLLLGFAVLWEIPEESKDRHKKHRVANPPMPEGAGRDALLAQQEGGETLADEQKKIARDNEEAGSEAEEEGATNSDDDFPDAKVDAGDSDDDFPDTKLDTVDSDDENDRSTAPNPLQIGGGADNSDDFEDTSGKDEQNTSVRAEVENTESDSDEAEAEGVTDSAAKHGKRYLSAHERRLLKKGVDPASLSQSANDSSQDDHSRAPTPSIISTAAGKNAPPLPRGKRNKKKKLVAKYAEQDEEDRALAMRFLGSKTGQEKKEEDAEARRAKEEEAEMQKQRRREQHLKKQAEGLKAEEARKAAMARADDAGNDADDEEWIPLDGFTGKPLPGDDLVAAVPVCAPWNALSTFKYKVKMQPGTQKKGKAVREILNAWDAAGKSGKFVDPKAEDTERIWPKELELIKGWKETEIVGIVPVSKVRVMLMGRGGAKGGGGSGGAKGGAKGKKGGKGGKKKGK
ncbi:hypothetical protein K402DRAFT_422027 [Aulographum hederae CBS 113979]|uniref:Ribosome quality control complex subunit 2 n=1 Tax=Aulographum hederae CBS 113979 TaxID=1176131 RepID=A0A6G1GWT5_9PEZI|nr:hypothetical protein K402DRAFT_422027 [Aulographum hederae CBS 113979]